ncbi:hypothetical protein Tco_0039999 [Tanacetum coccineum]
MPIPNELITDDIRGADYYDAYLKKVAKHQRYLAGEEVSDPDSPAPKPAKSTKPKITKQAKPVAPKAATKKPQPAPTKPKEKKRKQAKETTEATPPAKRAKAGKVAKKRTLKMVPAGYLPLAVKVQDFGGNEESKKMRKSMLKQEFQEFRVSEDEGLHKGYDRALPSSWSQVAITLKAKGGLYYLNFDDLYNKLKSLEIDIKGGSSYKSNHSTAPSHSAFVSTTSANNKMSYAETSKRNSLYIHLHHQSDPQEQIIYEDFNQIGKLDLEELDIKWKMAMLSVRINRFEKKAGRDELESNARYSAFKLKEMEQDKPAEPKALLSVDSMVNWSDHEESADDNASQVYGMIAGCDDEDEVAGEFALMGVTSQVQTCPFGCHDKNAELQKEFDDLEAQYKEYYIQVQAYKSTLKTLEQQKAWYQSNQLAYEEKIKVLERDLENTTNLLKYSENVNNNVNLEKQELQTKLDNALARFAKWKETSKNLAKLVDSSMSVKTKLGLGYGDYIGEDEVYYPTMPSIFDPTPEEVDGNPTPVRFVKEGEMNAVPPPITGKFMPTSIHSDFDESQMTYGKKSNDLPETDSNNFVSCDSSDKSSPKSGDSSVSSLSAAESESTSKTAVQEDISFNNTPTISCNKDGLRHYVKNKSSSFKSCFVCGSYSHLIKDCDFYENRMGVYSGHRESRPMWKNVDNIPPFVPQAAHGRSGKVTFPAGRVKVPAPIPTGRQTGPAPVYAGTPVPADGQNRPTPVHAGRPFPAGRRNSVLVSAGWRRSAARPMFRPISSHFQNSSRPVYYNEMYMGGGRWETAENPLKNKDLGIVDSGCSRSMSGNKERLDDFVEIKGGTVTFGGGEGRITGKGTIRTSKLDFENVYYVKELQNFNLFSLPDDSQVVLRVPRRHNLYSFNLNELQPEAKLPTPDRDWNKTLPAVHGPVQPYKPRLTKYEGLHILLQYPQDLRKPLPLIPNSRSRQVIPFDHFINNDLAYLFGGVFSRTYATSVTKTKAAYYGHIKWIEDLGRKRQQFYGFAANRVSARNVYSKRRIIAVTKLQIIEWHGYKHLDWITVRRDDNKLYTFKEGDFKWLRLQDIEDMLILLVQGKLINLNVEDRLTFGVSLRMFTRSIIIQRRVEDLQLGIESYQKKLNITKPDTYRSDLKLKDAYTTYSYPRGFIYLNKDKKNRLMRIDELHKFSDGTLDDIRTALNDRLKRIRMEYLPKII